MRYALLLCLATIVTISFWSCDPDPDFLTGDEVQLEFTLDTLRFDTVFTELGSATRSFRVINPSDQPARIDKIRIEGMTGVDFRMNVDGTPGDEVEQVDVFAGDSIWVFVEVTIDPDQPLSVSPFVIQDRIIFETGSRESSVWLEAWGQNANYFPSRFNGGIPVVLSCQDSIIWDSERPYVLYGEIFIDECILSISPGVDIYVHGGIARNDVFGVFNDGFLFTLPNGSIHFNGTPDKPITVQGDRLEGPFQDVSGQWLGIIFGPESSNNYMRHTNIKNSIFGCFVDSLATLDMEYTTISRTAGAAIAAKRSTVNAENCLFFDNAAGAVQIIQGGNYTFDHCTLANFGFDASALTLSNFQCYGALCEALEFSRLDAKLRNCIIFGSRRDEIVLSNVFPQGDPNEFFFWDVSFENCVVRVDELLENEENRYADFFDNICENCVPGEREDPLFIDRDLDNYQLDTMSIAINRGQFIEGLEIDLNQNVRDAMPDVGCFEFVN